MHPIVIDRLKSLCMMRLILPSPSTQPFVLRSQHRPEAGTATDAQSSPSAMATAAAAATPTPTAPAAPTAPDDDDEEEEAAALPDLDHLTMRDFNDIYEARK